MRNLVPEAIINASFQVGTKRIKQVYSLGEVADAWKKVEERLRKLELDEPIDENEIAECARNAALECIKAELLVEAIKSLIEDDQKVAEKLVEIIEKA